MCGLMCFIYIKQDTLNQVEKTLSGCYDSLMGSSTIADSSLISFVFLENSSNGQIGYSQ